MTWPWVVLTPIPCSVLGTANCFGSLHLPSCSHLPVCISGVLRMSSLFRANSSFKQTPMKPLPPVLLPPPLTIQNSLCHASVSCPYLLMSFPGDTQRKVPGFQVMLVGGFGWRWQRGWAGWSWSRAESAQGVILSRQGCSPGRHSYASSCLSSFSPVNWQTPFCHMHTLFTGHSAGGPCKEMIKPWLGLYTGDLGV